MKFFILNAAYKPGNTLDNFESLIWTERYRDSGDFKLTVENEISLLTKFPLGALVSHTDTSEVMIVENHEIERDSDKKLKVIISGRNFETFAENRYTLGSNEPLKLEPSPGVPGDEKVYTTSAMTPADLVRMLFRYTLEPGYASANDAIPNLSTSVVMRVADLAMVHVVPRGQLYNQALEYLKIGNVGIRTTRPIGLATTIDIAIHDGIDKRSSVIFTALNQDLEETKYFWSNQNYKNYAQVSSELETRLYRHKALGSDLTGLNRRVLYVGANDILGEIPTPTNTDAVAARGQTALDENQKITLVQARISKTAEPKFKIHYDIGDLVKVYTEFSTSQDMRITEHILTVDKNGSIGSPSLSAL